MYASEAKIVILMNMQLIVKSYCLEEKQARWGRKGIVQ